METIEETVRKNLCIVCLKNTKDKSCMNIEKNSKKDSTSYKCLNFCKRQFIYKLSKELEEEYKEAIVKHIFGSSINKK